VTTLTEENQLLTNWQNHEQQAQWNGERCHDRQKHTTESEITRSFSTPILAHNSANRLA